MDLIELLKVVIFGIVEGITEWLPISSTGHMILLEELLPLKNISDEFWEMFLVVIQLGAILAVCVMFFDKLCPFGGHKSPKKVRSIFNTWGRVIIGCIPAGICGVLFNDWFDEHFYNSTVVAATLIIYGILFIVVENRNKHTEFSIRDVSDLSYTGAFTIGMMQVLSLIPGTSRSGVTIIGAMLLGVSRQAAAEFSFFMSIPIMFGASLLKLLKFGTGYTSTEIAVLLVGMITAFIISVLAIKFLMDYIKKHDFKIFGIYRIILGIIVLGYFIGFKH